MQTYPSKLKVDFDLDKQMIQKMQKKDLKKNNGSSDYHIMKDLTAEAHNQLSPTTLDQNHPLICFCYEPVTLWETFVSRVVFLYPKS